MSSVNVNGGWKDFDKVYAKVNDVWKTVDKIFTNINGTWKEGYTSNIIFPNIPRIDGESYQCFVYGSGIVLTDLKLTNGTMSFTVGRHYANFNTIDRAEFYRHYCVDLYVHGINASGVSTYDYCPICDKEDERDAQGVTMDFPAKQYSFPSSLAKTTYFEIHRVLQLGYGEIYHEQTDRVDYSL